MATFSWAGQRNFCEKVPEGSVKATVQGQVKDADFKFAENYPLGGRILDLWRFFHCVGGWMLQITRQEPPYDAHCKDLSADFALFSRSRINYQFS